MDERLFEAALRSLGRARSRRQAVTAVLAALAAGALAEAGATTRSGSHQPGRRRRGPASQGPCGDGSRSDNTCTKDRDCCTGICNAKPAKKNRDGKGRCRCLRKGKPCAEDRNCCRGMTCSNGVCRPPCNPATCATGCCRDGICHPGTANNVCGTGGGTCAACGGGTPLCTAQTCAAGTWQAQTPFGDGEGAADDQFSAPSGVAVSADGLTLYVADGANVRISVWTRASTTAPWAAQTPIGNGSGSANDQFGGPMGIALAPDGLSFYVSDGSFQRISVWTRATSTAPWAAQTPLGDGFGSGNSNFNGPVGLAVAPDGLALYVADTGNNRIAVWTRTAVGAPWQAQAPIASGPGSGPDQLSNPFGVAVAQDNRSLYIVDSANARVSVWSRTSTSDPWQPQTTIGNGSGNAYDQFIYPYGATVTPDGLALYVSDPGNNWISVWTRASSADPWQAQTPLGTYGTGNDQVAGPAGLTLAADGLALYIADQANRRIAIWIYA